MTTHDTSLNNELEQDDFDPEDFDSTVGETLIEAHSLISSGGAPVSWAEHARVADLGDGTWVLTQDNDMESSVRIIPAPERGAPAAAVIAGILVEEFERAAALEFEEFDPENSLHPVVRKRLKNAVSDSTDESRTYCPACVISYLDDATVVELKRFLRRCKTSERERISYYDTWQALTHPSDPSAAALLLQLLTEQGEEVTERELLNVEAAQEALLDRQYYELGGAATAEAADTADGTYAAAADPATPIERLRDIAARSRAPLTIAALDANPAIDEPVLVNWAGSGKKRLIDFVLNSSSPPTEALILIARSATRSRAEKLLLHHATPYEIIEGLLESSDRAVFDEITYWQISPQDSPARAASISRLQHALKDRLQQVNEGG